MLALSLVVTGFGIATALYLERPAALRLRPPLQQLLSLPAEPHDPLAAAAAVPSRAEAVPAPPALPVIEPQAGTSAPPPPAQTAALEPPPKETAPRIRAPEPAVTGAAAYWVEYGVFVGPTYARRLQQALAARGLEAVVVASHGRDGRKLLRVRSPPLSDLVAARDAAATAKRALRLAALLHRGDPAAASPPHYWVQFAAFAEPKPAARLRQELRRAGISASVFSVRESSGKPLYLVRSTRLPSHAAALALGARGRQVARTDFLVGASAPAPHHARGPPSAVAASR